ncbi:hypothetical protein VTK73DRAFT_5626 [Phialemonium thermophilum]|uniref:Uncharacterized protein n=1 Tax=Phialemonium thermophilum TaxID=223376 RepID=A0ABR3V1X6_9PEZI
MRSCPHETEMEQWVKPKIVYAHCSCLDEYQCLYYVHSSFLPSFLPSPNSLSPSFPGLHRRALSTAAVLNPFSTALVIASPTGVATPPPVLPDDDDDDAAAGGGAKAVFALLEQTMNLPRLDGGNRESPPSAGGSKEADGTGSSKAVSAPTSRKRNAMALAVPGPNTLSLVLTALEKTKETSLVSKTTTPRCGC